MCARDHPDIQSRGDYTYIIHTRKQHTCTHTYVYTYKKSRIKVYSESVEKMMMKRCNKKRNKRGDVQEIRKELGKARKLGDILR